jgi:hypothetical protein
MLSRVGVRLCRYSGALVFALMMSSTGRNMLKGVAR